MLPSLTAGAAKVVYMCWQVCNQSMQARTVLARQARHSLCCDNEAGQESVCVCVQLKTAAAQLRLSWRPSMVYVGQCATLPSLVMW